MISVEEYLTTATDERTYWRILKRGDLETPSRATGTFPWGHNLCWGFTQADLYPDIGRKGDAELRLSLGIFLMTEGESRQRKLMQVSHKKVLAACHGSQTLEVKRIPVKHVASRCTKRAGQAFVKHWIPAFQNDGVSSSCRRDLIHTW